MSEDLTPEAVIPEVVLDYHQLDEREQNLIDQTIGELKDLVNEEALTFMERVGELLIKNFFDNSPEAASNINEPNKDKTKIQVFDAFIGRLESENSDAKWEHPILMRQGRPIQTGIKCYKNSILKRKIL